ncbi:nucleoside-triphosphatase [Thermithiobacillus tepidarius DSM 3134]|uniref:nucleoside-triphosphatase n=1 Tax=Thermithiobacillus tepidarius TaxID=929 RepID=UPI0003F64AF9|nr:nucleoside-triphosphatase [Thermithiobacillus tepidarius]
MPKKFLITGPDKGKIRTLLDRVIQGAGLPVAGIRGVPFSDPEVPHGPHVGYRLRDIASGEEAVVASMFFDGPPVVDKYGVDVAAIDRIVGLCRRQPLESRLVIIDEIGPIELSSDQFAVWIVEVLEGISPVVAMIDLPLVEQYRRYGQVFELESDADFQPILDAVLIGVQP